jgi:hypothetical protein
VNLTISTADHPSEIVRLAAIPTDGPYLQDVWLARVGPSVVALLRRAHQMARQAGGRAEVSFDAMSRALGLTAGDPTARHSSFGKTLDRAERGGLVVLRRGDSDALLVVWDQVAPLRRHHIHRLPEFVAQEHFRAMEPVAKRLADAGVDLSNFTDLGTNPHRAAAGGGPRGAPPTAIAHLDHLARHGAPAAPPSVTL